MSKVLIIGGIGFIGRNLVEFLTEQDCSLIRVIDKRKPTMAFMGERHKKAMEHSAVEFMQGGSPATIEKAFKLEDGSEFDYVINLAAETRFGEDPMVYEEKILGVAKMITNVAKKHKVKKFVEISSAQVYSPSKKPASENSKVKPWTRMAEYKLKTEELLKSEGLPLVVLRPAVVYGPGDQNGLMPRLIAGRVYKRLGKKLKCLWEGDLRLNTVHVRDLCKAIWHVCKKNLSGVYNIADKNDTDQKKVNLLLEKIFHIKTGFYPKIKSNLAKLNIKDAQKIVNDKHLSPWTQLLMAQGIEVSPLSPYIAPELLFDTHFCCDGSKIESTGFTYDHPKVTEELLQEELEYAIALNIFPAND